MLLTNECTVCGLVPVNRDGLCSEHAPKPLEAEEAAKIIQILFEANPHNPRQGNTKRLLGLGDDGKIYWYNGSKWEAYYV